MVLVSDHCCDEHRSVLVLITGRVLRLHLAVKVEHAKRLDVSAFKRTNQRERRVVDETCGWMARDLPG